MKGKFALVSILSGALAVGCSGEGSDSDPQSNPRATKADTVVAAQAVGDLLYVSNIATGGAAGLARAGLTEDEVADYLADIGGALDDPGCVSAVAITATGVDLDFAGCHADGEDIDGEVHVAISTKLGDLEVGFSGSLHIDGVTFSGEWQVKLTALAQIAFSGDVTIDPDDAPAWNVVFDGSWQWDATNLCPTIDLSVTVSSGGSSVSAQISNLDTCYGLCAAGVVVEIEGQAGFTPADGSVLIGDATLSCLGDGDLDLDLDPSNPSNPSDPSDPNDPNDPNDPPAGAISPKSGTWFYGAYTPITNTCGLAQQFDSSGPFALQNNGDDTFTVTHDGADPFDCTLSGSDYDCPNIYLGSEDAYGATLEASGHAEGSFSSNRNAVGTRELTIDCSGANCAYAEQSLGVSFPCTFKVSYEVATL